MQIGSNHRPMSSRIQFGNVSNQPSDAEKSRIAIEIRDALVTMGVKVMKTPNGEPRIHVNTQEVAVELPARHSTGAVGPKYKAERDAALKSPHFREENGKLIFKDSRGKDYPIRLRSIIWL